MVQQVHERRSEPHVRYVLPEDVDGDVARGGRGVLGRRVSRRPEQRVHQPQQEAGAVQGVVHQEAELGPQEVGPGQPERDETGERRDQRVAGIASPTATRTRSCTTTADGVATALVIASAAIAGAAVASWGRQSAGPFPAAAAAADATAPTMESSRRTERRRGRRSRLVRRVDHEDGAAQQLHAELSGHPAPELPQLVHGARVLQQAKAVRREVEARVQHHHVRCFRSAVGHLVHASGRPHQRAQEAVPAVPPDSRGTAVAVAAAQTADPA